MNIIFDEGDFDEIESNCPWKITTPSGNSENFIITKLRRSLISPCFISVTLHPTNDKKKITTFEIAQNKFLESQLSEALDEYLLNPKQHVDQYHTHVLGELTYTIAPYYMKIECASVYERKSSDKFGLEAFSHNYLEINPLKLQPKKDNRPTNVHPKPLRRKQSGDSFTLSTFINL